MPTSPSETFERWLRELPPARLEPVASRYAARAKELGLCVTQPDGSEKAIPPVLSPFVVDDAWLKAQVDAAQHLTALVHRVTSGMLAGPEKTSILDALFPFERTCIESAGLAERLATVRADLFVGERGAQALELNATIPAMQGYSDIAVRAFLEAVGPELGLDAKAIERAVTDNGENARALFDALQLFCRARTGKPFERVALVHRPQDAQLSELRYLSRRWEQLGVRTFVIEVGELAWDGARVTARGEPVDFVYRHIFARRIEPDSGLGQMLQKRQTLPLSNPVAAPLEMKATFAELSRTAHEPALAKRYGLNDAALERVRAFVPWTRPLKHGPTDGPEGERIDELVAHVAHEPARYVLKRSWDYGGRAVFLGFEADLPVTRERAAAAFGEPLAWPELVKRAADDPRGGGFVVQERVVTQAAEHLLVTADGARWLPFFTDFSVYASLGQQTPGWGGVVRASTSAVVNIASGGGVAPVLRAQAAAPLLAALAKK
ncbi:MAG: hypothetical protein JST54_08940 [Deltaproteobacteria bacterium]|nr:hypothetical protein [Deltaproteobacteria bacterium]